MDNRLRFSIAHEIGHLILHGEIFKNLDFDSPEEWISNYSEIPEKTYSSIEYHAYEFAGRLLVPREALIKEIGKVVEISKKLHLDKIGISGPRLLGYASPKIAKVFGVSDAVIEKRFIYEELQDYLK
jgi:Zn-dependent peptidase ImmA (M78 family)